MDENKSTSGSHLTLIEVILVLAIILVLAGIVYVSFFPKKDIQLIRNSQRQTDATVILETFWRYALDHNGSFQPEEIPAECKIASAPRYICNQNTATELCSAIECVYSAHLIPKYLPELPAEPLLPIFAPQGHHLGYQIELTLDNQLKISAPHAEDKEVFADGSE